MREIDAFETMTVALEEGRALRLLSEAELHRGFTKGYGLLTDMPLLCAVNVDEDRAAEELDPGLADEIQAMGGAAMVLSASVEAEIASLEPEEQPEFLEDMGLSEPVLARFIRTAYGLMDLVSFFTIGRTRCARGRSGGVRWRARPPDASTATWSAASSARRSSRMRCSQNTARSRRSRKLG